MMLGGERREWWLLDSSGRVMPLLHVRRVGRGYRTAGLRVSGFLCERLSDGPVFLEGVWLYTDGTMVTCVTLMGSFASAVYMYMNVRADG